MTDAAEYRALRDNEAFLRMASRLGRLGAWSVDVPSLVHRWSDTVRDLHEWEGPGHPTLDELIAFYAPEDRASVQDAVARCMADGTPFDLECGFITAKGRRLWVRALGDAERDEHGATVRIQGAFQDITQRREGEQQRRLHQAALDAASDCIVLTDRHGVVEWVNPAFVARYGYAASELIGRTPGAALKSGAHDQAFYQEMWTTILGGRVWSGEITNRCRDGREVIEDLVITPIRDASHVITHFIGIKRDITAQRKLEGQLRQSQKMESVGRLAGGVAHDFNNLLTAITGYAAFVLEDIAPDAPARADVEEILAASKRASALTAQLLAFSRKQVLKPKVLDLNAAVTGVVTMLTRIVGEDVALTTNLCPQPCWVLVDPGQLDQVLLNLSVNARDAMLSGGTLTFETGSDAGGVSLTIRDTGCGMSREVLDHIFEPFYTTKGVGKGTGLGLSTVYGIVQQSGGTITVDSTPGLGTSFHISLPQIDATTAPARGTQATSHGGTETILLVEDEAVLRRLSARVLSVNGYTVLTASNGVDALNVLDHHDRPIDLLVTDIVMPGMNGRDLARSVAAKLATIKTLFMSGYTDGVLEPGVSFLQKPYTPDALLTTVREVLDHDAPLA